MDKLLKSDKYTIFEPSIETLRPLLYKTPNGIHRTYETGFITPPNDVADIEEQVPKLF